jgi:hypothetical protein
MQPVAKRLDILHIGILVRYVAKEIDRRAAQLKDAFMQPRPQS